MSDVFTREGELTDINSYPRWAQDMVESCAEARAKVSHHELFHRMRDAALDASQISTFLVGVWPVIEQFPQYMAQNLLKVQYGRSRGHDEARRYLIRNIRVEQNHADHWMEWSVASGVSRDDLLHGEVPPETHALAHWCWHTCERDPLAIAMAATNYAIEGTTGEWAAFVCGSSAYENGFPEDVRKQAMKWLRVHAHYDDTHPWEALEIVATLLGHRPDARDIAQVRAAIVKSYQYMSAAFDDCLAEDKRRAPRRHCRPGVPALLAS